ncbi:MAG TPA: hypothetical protein VGM94_09230 [Galbitalea sp.]
MRLAKLGRAGATGLTLAACAILLTACVGSPRDVDKTPTPIAAASESPTPTPTATPTGPPVLEPNGTAAANLAYFNLVGHNKFAGHPNILGRAIVDDLVAAGFVKKDMEITPDKTSIGLAAWNIEFSVKMNDSCLIGQTGNVGFQSFAAPLLASEKCLIGQTRTIDW